MKIRFGHAAIACAASTAAVAFGAGNAHAADSAIFAGTTTTTNSVTLKLEAPSLNTCNSTVVIKGTLDDPNATVAWTGLYELLSTDPALKSTPRFTGVPDEYFGPRSVTISLAPGTYTALGKCTPYNASGNYDGEDTAHTKTFTIGGGNTETPGDDDSGDSAWSSLEELLG